MPKEIMRIAAVGDLHCTKGAQGAYQPFFANIGEYADVLCLCGDLTDYGTPEEAQILVKELSPSVKIPIVAVLGNHDYETGQQDEVRKILRDSGIHVLDGESIEIEGVGFAGTKGYIGGFGRHTLGAWGEAGIKNIVREAQDEVLKLESALARLRTEHRVVLLHYSPVAATVVGEPESIFPFLGTSRLEEPLLRHPLTVVFHGHAHRGTMEGKTISNVPVYNVAMPLLRRERPHMPPYRVVELAMTSSARAQANQPIAGAPNTAPDYGVHLTGYQSTGAAPAGVQPTGVAADDTTISQTAAIASKEEGRNTTNGGVQRLEPRSAITPSN
jgi:Icc-related predicted phosphoesterase